MARWMDSWMYGMMDGRTDRWMEGINCFFYITRLTFISMSVNFTIMRLSGH